MEQVYKNIVLVMDPQASARSTIETAFSLARTQGARVHIVDTVRPPSRSSRFFSSSAEDVFEMVVADKQDRIRKVKNRFLEAGIEADGKLLYGKSSEAITRAAIEWDADLVVRYMKGVQSRYPGLFGNTARNLMRICPAPVLFVGNQPLDNPKVLACVNAEHESAENSVILTEASKLAANRADLSAVYCWNLHGQDFLKHYMSQEIFQSTLDESESLYRSVMEDFVKKHDLESYGDRFHFLHGEPADLIPQVCKQESVDVVVMSSASQTHPLRRLLGSTIETVLDQLPCALLIVKQEGFKSPVKPAASTAEV